MQLQSEIRRFIVENFLYGDNEDDLGPDTSLLKRGVIDSTGVLELVAFVERHYGISVTDDELVPDNFDSINRLNSFILQKKGNESV